MNDQAPNLPQRRRAGSYMRVSTDDQETARQKDMISRWAAANNIELVCWIEEPEGVSGRAKEIKKSPAAALKYFASLAGEDFWAFERVGFGDLLRRVRAGEMDMVVMSDLDRASRSTIELLLLDLIFAKYGVSIAVVGLGGVVDTSSAGGKTLFRMLAIMAEVECDRTADRTRSKLAQKNAAGEFVGRPPVGWKAVQRIVDGELVTVGFAHDPEDWPRVVKAAKLKADGFTYAEIAAEIGRHLSRVKAHLDAFSWTPPDGMLVIPETDDQKKSVPDGQAPAVSGSGTDNLPGVGQGEG